MGPAGVVTADLLQGDEGKRVTLETTALVIGGGATGLFSSILLAQHGIDCIVVERHEQRLGQPKAHALNPRSLEILKQAGLDTIALRRMGMSPQDGDMVRFATSLKGLEFGSLPYERQQEDAKEITPEPLFNISQPTLEKVLTEAVENSKLISLKKPAQYNATYPCDKVHKSPKLWLSSVSDKKTNEDFVIKSKYILICDGANSTSRLKFGIPFSVMPGHSPEVFHNVSIHFDADLRQFKSGTLWFFMRESQKGTMICYNRQDSWVYVVRRRPEKEPISIFTEGYCRSMINDAIGQDVPYNVLSITHWTTMPQVADYYRSVAVPEAFILGDAAHAFPPTGGLGLNTGIADSHNLVWKIHAVEAGWSSPRFLDTYDRERRPIAIANGHQSQINLRNLHELLARTFARGATDDQLINDARFHKLLRSAIENNRDHFDSINLQIGYIYGEGCLGKLECSPYIPRCVPGARLVHIWIKRNGLKCSTLDLVDGSSFVLLTSQNFPQVSFVEGEDHSMPKIPLSAFRLGEDFTVDQTEWSERMSFREDDVRAILVRPDQHVLGVVESASAIPFMLQSFLNP